MWGISELKSSEMELSLQFEDPRCVFLLFFYFITIILKSFMGRFCFWVRQSTLSKLLQGCFRCFRSAVKCERTVCSASLSQMGIWLPICWSPPKCYTHTHTLKWWAWLLGLIWLADLLLGLVAGRKSHLSAVSATQVEANKMWTKLNFSINGIIPWLMCHLLERNTRSKQGQPFGCWPRGNIARLTDTVNS